MEGMGSQCSISASGAGVVLFFGCLPPLPPCVPSLYITKHEVKRWKHVAALVDVVL